MAEWEITLRTNDINPNADLNNLKEDLPIPYPGYAHCLPRYAKLNGNFENVKGINAGHIGYMSTELSDADGVFKTPPVITVSFSRKKTSDGFHMIFNELSGDYCSDLVIQWFKYGKQVAEQEFYPDSAEYMCNAKVGLFDKAVITFKKTSKPYRYLWLAQLENTRLTQGEGLRIVYNDVAYLGKEHTTIKTNDAGAGSNLKLLLQETEIQFPYYATGLPSYSKLNGMYINSPDALKDLGFISDRISNADGTFEDPPQIEMNLSEAISSMGIQLNQNNASGDYCDLVNIKWYLEGSLVEDKDFQPDSAEYICAQQVDDYDKVIIAFKHTSKPYRYAVLTGFQYGAVRVFTTKEITDCSVFDEIAPAGDSVPISTLNFSVRNESFSFDFEKAQRLYVYFDEQIIGRFYLKSATRNNKYNYTFDAEDVISFLESNMHKGGFYNGADAAEVIQNEIFAGVDVSLDLSMIKGMTITGWLPYDTCRNNLAQICFALGLVIDTSFETKVYIYQYDPDKKPVDISNSMIYSDTTSIDSGEIITGVNLTVHAWVKNTVDDPDELYKGTLNGQTTVKFDEPKYELSISGGSIVESGDNYAVISGNGSEVLLKGRKYNHVQQIISMEKEHVYRNKKFAESTDATLVTSVNASEVLSRMFSYYVNNESMTSSIVLDDVELADIVKVDTFDGSRKGIVKSLDMRFYGEIKAEATIKCLT